MTFKKMRIAVCLYGQPRTGIYTAPWIKEWFNIPAGTEINTYKKTITKQVEFQSRDRYDVEVDYFLHLKNFNIYFNTRGDDDTQNPIAVPQEDLEQLINIYQPKKYEYSTYEQEETLVRGNHHRNHYSGMFYSIATTLRLKKEYELEMGFNYDYCFAHRYDSIVGNNINTFKNRLSGPGLLPLSILATQTQSHRWETEYWRLGPDDTFFGGDNLAMELLIADISRVYAQDNIIYCNDDWAGPNIVVERSIHNVSISLDYDPNLTCAIVRHRADLTRPVLESWQYHQNFWISNHKGIE